MRFDPQISVLFEQLSPPFALNREDFETVRKQLLPLSRTACGIAFRFINRPQYEMQLSFDWRNDPTPPAGEDDLGIKVVVAHSAALRILRRSSPEILPLISKALTALVDADLPVGGAGNQGGIKLFRTVDELHTWLTELPSGYPSNNPPVPFCPYPRTQ